MTEDITTITVTVRVDEQTLVRQVEATHWARDDERTLYVYRGDRTLLEVADEYVVSVLREEAVETILTATGGDEPTTTTTTTN